MTSNSPKGACLVARAVPTQLPADATDQLTDRLEQLSVEEAINQKKIAKVANNVTPSDFVTLQSIRSSALARKTNTTFKFSRGGPALFADLLNKDAQKDEPKDNKPDGEKAETKEKDEKDGKSSDDKEDEDSEKSEEKTEAEDGELLSRGPVRNVRASHAHHPYHVGGIAYGTAAQTAVQDFSAFSNYGSGYECGSTWSDSPDTMGYISSSSTPDTVLSEGYLSASPQQHSPYSDRSGAPPSNLSEDHTAEITRLLDSSDLPETLADFILAYSRQYTEQNKAEMCSPRVRPPSADSGVNSPMSARSAPHASPQVPTGSSSGPTTPSESRSSPRKSATDSTAKQRLHSKIKENELAEGFHWAVTCAQCAPGALTFRDADGDTLLHIVVAHMDLGKIYALSEQMRKMERNNEQKPFDQENKFHETPLYVAVVQRSPEVVAYLLEIGADPNVQTTRGDRDTTLHYAASRGMSEVLELLISAHGVKLNELNARGQTALMCAVKNHGIIDEPTQQVIDNSEVIASLLRAGADPTIAESTTGKTIVHVAVEKLDLELFDLLQKNMKEDQMCVLANIPDFSNEKPVDFLGCEAALVQQQKKTAREGLYIRLLAYGGTKTLVSEQNLVTLLINMLCLYHPLFKSGHLPVIFAIVFVINLAFTYIVAVVRGDVDPLFPYVSAAADHRPESCFFSALLNISSALSALIILLRSELVKRMLSEEERFLLIINKISLFFSGCLVLSECLSLPIFRKQPSLLSTC
ncbi:unnamed protein product [Caenorhabditis auriculariae]|uniref:CWH43-like N-terminal domain-containing protein n=1 Tax=Caenorhabditis auriculariae TaxID=2777116 RepID=A0A8S1GTP3_9PELO|nr:unnamed protein product [Caenorhabditis auriculariae]